MNAKTTIQTKTDSLNQLKNKSEKYFVTNTLLKQAGPTKEKSLNTDLDTIKNSIKEAYLILRTYGVNRINLHLNNTGLLTAKGYVGNDQSWEKAKTSILGDIDAINDIDETGIETLKSRSIVLDKLLKENNLKSSLHVDTTQSENTIKVSGEITHNDLMQWEQVKAIFLQENGSEPVIEEKITDLEKNINLSIRSVSVGRTAFFVSDVGKKYMAGSDLGHGYQVGAIKKDRIILHYKGKKIPIFYNQLMRSINKKTIRS